MVRLLSSVTYTLSWPSTASEMGMPRRSLPLSRRLYFDWTKSNTCTAFAPGSATKIRPFESVVTADGDCNASMRGSGSLGPAMMSRVRLRAGWDGPLASSAEENARTKFRRAELCGTSICAAWAGTMQPVTMEYRTTPRVRRMDLPRDTTTDPGLIPLEMPRVCTVRRHSGT